MSTPEGDDAAVIHSIDLPHGFVLNVGANRSVSDGFGLGHVSDPEQVRFAVVTQVIDDDVLTGDATPLQHYVLQPADPAAGRTHRSLHEAYRDACERLVPGFPDQHPDQFAQVEAAVLALFAQ